MYFTFQRIVQGYGLTDLDQPDIRISFFICIKSGMRGLSDPIGGQLAFGGGDIENHSGSHVKKISIDSADDIRSEEHTSELQSRGHLVCRLLLEKKNNKTEGTSD